MNSTMHIITFLFNLLVFLVPLAFFPKTSELFEFNKIILIYGFTILISAVWILECIKRKKIIFRNTQLTIPLLLFLLSQVLATLFSIDQRTSLLGYYGRFHGGLLSTVCYVILYLAFVTFMDKGKTLKLINTLLISAFIAAIYASLEHFGLSPSCLLISGNFDVSCWVQDIQARVFGTFGQPNWLAAYLVSLAPLAWSQALRKKSIIYVFLSALLFTTLLFTKSRSGLLGFGFAFFIFWPAVFYLYRKNIKKILKVFFLTTCYILFTTIFIWNPFVPSSEAPIEGVTESGDIRKIVWQGAIELWKQYPILGTGVETFAYSYYETRPVAHNLTSEWNFIYNKAHNEYLNFAATTGTIGLASYLILIITSLSIFVKNFQYLKIESLKLEIAALCAGYVSILITNFFGFSTVPTALLFFLFPAMAVTVESPPASASAQSLRAGRMKLPILLATCYMLQALARYWLADYYFAKGDIESLEKAVMMVPREAVYHDKLAEEYKDISPQLAQVQLELSIKLSPRNIKLLKSAASIYDDFGELDSALAIYKKLTVLAPTDAQVWYSLALTQVKLGNSDEAKRILLKVFEMKPDYEKAHELFDILHLP